MIEIIRERDIVIDEKYGLLFSHMNRGEYLFPCDKDGRVIESGLGDEARKNLQDCLAGQKTGEVQPPEVLDLRTSYVEPAVGRCSCGRKVELSGFTNSCDCGMEYASSGQALAPRCQWGEETGEHPADISRIP